MRLIVPVPGLEGASWILEVYPKAWLQGQEHPDVHPERSTPFTFVGSPTGFGRKRSKSTDYLDHPSSYITVEDIFHSLFNMLQKNARKDDYLSLPPRQQKVVSEAFWLRCHELEEQDGQIRVWRGRRRLEEGEILQEEEERMEMEIEQAVGRLVRKGLRRIDFLDGKTR